MYLLFLIVLIFKLVDCQLWVKVHTIHACEGHNLTLYCYITDEIIVTIANYGRTNYNVCQFFEISDNEKEKKIKCSAINTTTIIRNKCNRKSRCTIEATNSMFGDPCPGEIKYLEASYFCRRPPDNNIDHNDMD